MTFDDRYDKVFKVIIFHDNKEIASITNWDDGEIILHRWNYRDISLHAMPLRDFDYPVDYYYACKIIGIDNI